MGTVLKVGGRVVAASAGWRPARRAPPPDLRVGEDGVPYVPLVEAIPPEASESPFRAGIPWTDPATGQTWRVVAARVLDPAAGWGAAEFWRKRWGCTAEALRALCERGLLDAAAEEGTGARRYRCRDERAARAFLAGLRAATGGKGAGRGRR